MKIKHIALLLVATLLLSSFASAGFFGNVWNKLTGNAVTPPVPEAVNPIGPEAYASSGSGRVATVSPIGPESPAKLTAKGLFLAAENQVKQLSNSFLFKNNRNAQAALKKIKADIEQLKTIAAAEKLAAKSATRATPNTRTRAISSAISTSLSASRAAPSTGGASPAN